MKIDTTKIAGYEEMSAEDKLKALEGFEFDDPKPATTDEAEKLRAALTKANGEAAEWKRQYREKLSEQERAEAERAEREKAVEEELRGLRRDKSVSGFVAQCLSLGYSKELAQRAAEAMADNNAAEILACQQEFLEAKKKEYEATALNKQPKLTSGAPPVAETADKDAINKTRRYWGLPPI